MEAVDSAGNKYEITFEREAREVDPSWHDSAGTVASRRWEPSPGITIKCDQCPVSFVPPNKLIAHTNGGDVELAVVF